LGEARENQSAKKESTVGRDKPFTKGQSLRFAYAGRFGPKKKMDTINPREKKNDGGGRKKRWS